jgi:hypothetical protein
VAIRELIRAGGAQVKEKEYYDDMRSFNDCITWANSVGLDYESSNHRDGEIILKRELKSELNLSLVYDDDHDDLMFINHMNRLRRWKETEFAK